MGSGRARRPGKTYTTLGPTTSPDFFSAPTNGGEQRPEHEHVGLMPRALRDLFAALEGKRAEAEKGREGSPGGKPTFEFRVTLTFLELYGEEVRDLLAPHSNRSSSAGATKIVIRDSAGDAEALGATSVPVSTASQAMVVLTRGMLRRVTGATAMNAESSRSHAIMSVQLEQVTRTAGGDEEEATVVRRSKYNFVDLAGSERSKRTHAKPGAQLACCLPCITVCRLGTLTLCRRMSYRSLSTIL